MSSDAINTLIENNMQIDLTSIIELIDPLSNKNLKPLSCMMLVFYDVFKILIFKR